MAQNWYRNAGLECKTQYVVVHKDGYAENHEKAVSNKINGLARCAPTVTVWKSQKPKNTTCSGQAIGKANAKASLF